MITRSLIAFFCILLTGQNICAQTDSLQINTSTITDIDNRIINGLQKKYSDVESILDKQSAKLLIKMLRKEDKLHAKLTITDSVKAHQLFNSDVRQQYRDLQSGFSKPTGKPGRFPLKEYMPGLDSVQTSLYFFIKNSSLPTDKLKQLQILNARLIHLEETLQKANDIQTFIKEREALLKEQLMNTGLFKELKGINKQVYYYQAHLAEYKVLLNDKQKLKEKLLETVRTLPAFQKFWERNSYLSQLFAMPGNYNSAAQALAGLQTTVSIQQVLQQRFGNQVASPINSSVPGGDLFQQAGGMGQTQLNELKDKVSNTLGSNSDMAMPVFKPDEQKTKSFLKRLEYGMNFQSEAGTSFLPATTDIALHLGYKIGNNKVFGIGASYKLGWGSGWDNIRLSSQGIGVRSYIDIKAKGSFWLSGGFEYNYLSSFSQLRDLHENVDVWQCSALAGITKKYKIGKKREGKIQVLYDFLHNNQTPPSQGLKFRVGWNF